MTTKTIEEKEWEIRENLITGYFHQDWSLDFTWQEVIQAFISTHNSEEINILYSWIIKVYVDHIGSTSDLSELEMWLDMELGENLMKNLGFASYGDWFMSIAEILKQHLVKENIIK